jgi:hypothetical protein
MKTGKTTTDNIFCIVYTSIGEEGANSPLQYNIFNLTEIKINTILFQCRAYHGCFTLLLFYSFTLLLFYSFTLLQ